MLHIYIYDISRLRVNVHGSVHHESMSITVQQDATMYNLLYSVIKKRRAQFRSPLIHVVGRSFCLYTDSLFDQIDDSSDKCSSSLEVEC